MRIEMQTATKPRQPRGYTLIEMLLVMGIIIMLVTLVLVSVNSMLRSSKMNRAVNLIVAAVDEARTAAVTIRRTTRVDVTPLDSAGKVARMTVFGPGVSDNFEEYNLPDPSQAYSAEPPQDKRLTAAWKTSGSKQPQLVTDGSRCLKIRGLTGAAAYWYPGLRVDAVNVGDYYEAILFARLKILPGQQRVTKKPMTIGILGSIDDNGGKAIKSAYGMALKITPAAASARNDSSSVELQRFSGSKGTALAKGDSKDGDAAIVFDAQGSPSSPTALLVEGVWYRVLLSVKSYTPEDKGAKAKAIVSGKIWADGQLEPLTYTVGPITDTKSPLSNGFGGFSVENCDAVVDDVLFDMRPVRLVPQGISISPLDPGNSYNYAELNSRYSFPLMFRPDGTTSVFSIIEIADTSTGDKKYVRIDQNTGRARIAGSLEEVKK
jgi:type II secretory pathway pseudopilin PulG